MLRFIEKRTDLSDPEGCWPWTGTIRKDGYGAIYHEDKQRNAHRVVYIELVGPVPDELPVDHLCHNWDTECPGGKDCLHRRCVNPDHLEPVTVAENNRRGNGWAGEHSQATHCPQGHPYDEENTYRWSGRSMRQCRTCHRDRQRRYRAAKKERTQGE